MGGLSLVEVQLRLRRGTRMGRRGMWAQGVRALNRYVRACAVQRGVVVVALIVSVPIQVGFELAWLQWMWRFVVVVYGFQVVVAPTTFLGALPIHILTNPNLFASPRLSYHWDLLIRFHLLSIQRTPTLDKRFHLPDSTTFRVFPHAQVVNVDPRAWRMFESWDRRDDTTVLIVLECRIEGRRNGKLLHHYIKLHLSSSMHVSYEWEATRMLVTGTLNSEPRVLFIFRIDKNKQNGARGRRIILNRFARDMI